MKFPNPPQIVFLGLLAFWCAAWPTLLAWSVAHGILTLAVLAVALVVGTPIIIFLRMRHVVEQMHQSHQKCHAEVDDLFDKAKEMFDEAQRISVFRGFELAAKELEMIQDGLIGVPPRHVIDPRTLATAIGDRVRVLRAMAPDLPTIQLQALLASDDEV